jgi:hypothetical protein
VQPVVEAFEQLIPSGLLVTVPLPVMDTVSASLGGVKVAVTLVAAATVTLHVDAVPVHAPDQPAKVPPVSGVSLSATAVLGAKAAVQVVGVAEEQLIPAGALVTVPLPVPANATVNPTPGLNVAETLVAALMAKLHVLPEQLPPQPAK